MGLARGRTALETRDVDDDNQGMYIPKKRRKADLRAEIEQRKAGDLVDQERLSLDFSMAERNIPQDDRFIFQRILGH